MHYLFATKLDSYIKKKFIWVQKIERSYLNIFDKAIVCFLIKDKQKKIWSLQKTFLMANIGMWFVLTMLFLTLSSVKLRIADK